MKKGSVVEGVIILCSVGVAARLGFELAGHGVAVAAVTSTVLSVLWTGIFFAIKVGEAATVELFKCPAAGCDTVIRAQHVSAQESQRLRSVATDHTRHAGGA